MLLQNGDRSQSLLIEADLNFLSMDTADRKQLSKIFSLGCPFPVTCLEKAVFTVIFFFFLWTLLTQIGFSELGFVWVFFGV